MKNLLLDFDAYRGTSPDGTFSLFLKKAADDSSPKIAVILCNCVKKICSFANVKRIISNTIMTSVTEKVWKKRFLEQMKYF